MTAGHAPRRLDRRTLNRTLLDRQLLAGKSALPLDAAVAHLVVYERARPLQVCQLRRRELLAELEVVGAKCFSESSFQSHGGPPV